MMPLAQWRTGTLRKGGVCIEVNCPIVSVLCIKTKPILFCVGLKKNRILLNPTTWIPSVMGSGISGIK